MLLWGLAGWVERGRLVTTADQAGTSALRKPMADMGLRFRYFYEIYDKPVNMERIVGLPRAVRAAASSRARGVGQMGYRDMNLYGTMFDGVSLRARAGIEMSSWKC